MAEFSELMARGRETLSISLRELSSIVGISPGQLSNYERGVSAPKREVVIAISEALDIPVNMALMASGFTPVYYNAADEEAAQIAEEHANYFIKRALPNQLVTLVSKVMESDVLLNLNSAVTHSQVFSAHLSGTQIAAMTKVGIALKLLKEAEKDLKELK